MVSIEINGKTLQAENGQMLIEVADKAGIEIPRFCYHKKLSVAASCRMCLVEVEKAPKPMPACATPISDGMKVFTKSTKAIAAQKSVMEFLLINHPLDCPVCDQGGECDLQDISVGYGDGASQYVEVKRVVKDKDIGPLISTEMTRCIHCTRCVRFGQEIAGVREMGATGRGDHMEIGLYVEGSVDSELSGNIIDLCPVGALTSKPFRFSARPWEMKSHESIAAHDCVGSNITVHTLRDSVKRVIARENDAINETWISDRDRFAYLGLNSEQRLLQPMQKVAGEWQVCGWEDALHSAVEGFKKIIAEQSAEQIGAIVSPSSSIEELSLIEKLMRGLGSNNLDHRLRQTDYSDQNRDPLYLGLGIKLNEITEQNAIFVIGSNVRKEQPIIGHRIRQASLKGSQVSLLNPGDYPLNFNPLSSLSVAPQEMFGELKAVAKAVMQGAASVVPDGLFSLVEAAEISKAQQQIADSLIAAEKAVVILGSLAQTLPDYAEIRKLASYIAEQTGAVMGYLTLGANASGASIAGFIPHKNACAESQTSGLAVQQMLENPLAGYLLAGIEAELDIENPAQAVTALSSAFVVSMTSYVTDEMKEYADILLPMSVSTETSGTFVNIEGTWQSFSGIAKTSGLAKPGWKIARVLGNLFDLSGFDYVSSEEVKDELLQKLGDKQPDASLAWECPITPAKVTEQIQRISETPIYAVDAATRRATALQDTQDGQLNGIRINQKLADKLKLSDGQKVTAKQGETSCESVLSIDNSIPDNCLHLAAATTTGSSMGKGFSAIEINAL